MKREKKITFGFKGILVLAGLAVFQACSPAPRHTLTREEKLADLQWVFSQFTEYYAPLDYKEDRYGFHFDELKKKYLSDSENTKNNDEFYSLLYKFIAEFKDAHTSASIVNASAPSRTEVGYLGFDAKRKGDTVIVTKLLPTIDEKKSAYPIKVGDVISKLDGVPLKQVVLDNFLQYANLGQEETNLTYHMSKMFFRVSSRNGLPDKENAKLTVIRKKTDGSDYEEEIILPWVIKDLFAFTEEQKAAAKLAEEAKRKKDEEQGKRKTAVESDYALFQIGSLILAGQLSAIPSIVSQITHGLPGYKFWNSFVFVDSMPTWNSKILKDTLYDSVSKLPQGTIEGLETPDNSSLAELKKERQVPENAMFITEAKTYPTYVVAQKVLDKSGKPTDEVKYVAVMYLNTFSPAADENDVLKEVKTTLTTLQSNGVKDLVIDMINNGGGSLRLGILLAQLLSDTKVIMPDIQFGLNEGWIDQFESDSRNAPSDSEREIAKRVYEDLKFARNNGASPDKPWEDHKRLSQKWNLETLVPFQVQRNLDLTQKFNVALVVNEMCASMCDIFTSILKDNGLATVVGSKTMGAGGNVEQIMGSAPNSHFMIRQTESLILKKDGSYIENNGIEPDVAIQVNESSDEKYLPVLKKAAEQLTKR